MNIIIRAVWDDDEEQPDVGAALTRLGYYDVEIEEDV